MSSKPSLKRLYLLLIVLMYSMISTGAYAQGTTADPALSFKKDYPAVTIESIEKTEIDGIYEVFSGGNILYYSPKTGNLIFGEMITRDFRNVTMDRKNVLIAAALKTVPLDKAIRIGTGKHVVIEFIDIDCPYCRQLEEYFNKQDDVSRYVFLLPLEKIHPDSMKKAIAVLCSPDRSGAYRYAMKGNYDNMDAPACSSGDVSRLLEEYKAVAMKVGVQGTPALWIDGVSVSGANIPQIESLLIGSGELAAKGKEVKPQ
jgi:thiol:disulfide interchange protein DsbC